MTSPSASTPPTQEQPAAASPPRPAGTPAQAAPKPRHGAAESGGTFGDGSTQEQQDQLIKEAEEANAAVKKVADAEREARSQ